MEMAVVMAIIGLIAGGIMGGKNLLRIATIRKIGTEATGIFIGINQFQKQYEYLPGDFPTATSVWGAVAAGCPNAASIGKTTCNGDGNGIIDMGAIPETHRAWQQLWAAGYIGGSYTGITGPGHAYAHVVPGTNSPAGPLRSTGYSFISASDQLSNATYFDGNYDNVVGYGTQTTASTAMQNALLGKEAYDLDSKLDDGLPGMGNIRTYKGIGVTNMSRNCASSGVSTSATYVKTTSTANCSLLFLRDFKSATKI